ncbi:MAG TPA: ABC transporter permease [Nitrolancea sp.]|jgi:ABC-type dipeptide/oligopeptide/nickel transport system permease subunit|nr:ABC transporter permease [Nitrolancea sp.]
MQGSIEQSSTVTIGAGYVAGMGRRRRWQMLRVLVRNRASLAGLMIIVLMIILGLAASWLAPYVPSQTHIRDKVQAPNSTYWLGTDQFGRDILSRLLYGTRISLTLSITGVALATITGTVIGSIAGFGQRWVDEVLMRIMDVLMAFPYIVLAIALIAVVGPSLQNIVLVVAFTRVPQFARLSRASVLSLKQAEYVVAARAIGLPDWRILFRHIMPNIVTPIVVLGSLSMATAILTESSLSFLGLGVQPPTASWGTMIGDGRNYVGDGFWISTVPGIAISLTILGFNLLGDGLRDALDPRLRTRA